MKIISYNVWFSNYKMKERLMSLIDTINVQQPDIVCLQEVVKYQHDELKKIGYNIYPAELKDEYECVILSKYPIDKFNVIKMPSNMNRKICFIKVSVNEKDIVIVNVHFESEFRKTNTIKIMQYKYVSLIVNKLYMDYKNVILCSDTNVTINDTNYFNKYFDEMNDSWEKCGFNKDNQYTYDCETNNNLQSRKIKLRSRIDRIMFRCNDLYVDNFSLLNVNNNIQPSDHHGIVCFFLFTK